MGLYAYEIEVIADLIERLPAQTALSLGHPDILATSKELESVFGKRLPINNEEVRKSRKYLPGPDIIGDATIVFDAFGVSLKVLDKRTVFGVDQVADLNDPLPANYPRFGLVVDPGTTEHCFNVAQALKNVAETVMVDGFVYHMVPLCNFNHGYWNFSPVAFSEFYTADNGYEIQALRGRYKNDWVEVERSRKFKYANSGIKLSLMCVAKRVRDVPIRFPTLQGKYQR